jgi:hypothetical protein
MNLFETKYRNLLDLTIKKRKLEKYLKASGYSISSDRQKLSQINYQIDQIIRSEDVEKQVLIKQNA